MLKKHSRQNYCNAMPSAVCMTQELDTKERQSLGHVTIPSEPASDITQCIRFGHNVLLFRTVLHYLPVFSMGDHKRCKIIQRDIIIVFYLATTPNNYINRLFQIDLENLEYNAIIQIGHERYYERTQSHSSDFAPAH